MYKVSKKIDDKWLSFGNVKKNKFDKMQLGLRVTALLKKIMAETPENEWVNFALFDEDKPAEGRSHDQM